MNLPAMKVICTSVIIFLGLGSSSFAINCDHELGINLQIQGIKEKTLKRKNFSEADKLLLEILRRDRISYKTLSNVIGTAGFIVDRLVRAFMSEGIIEADRPAAEVIGSGQGLLWIPDAKKSGVKYYLAPEGEAVDKWAASNPDIPKATLLETLKTILLGPPIIPSLIPLPSNPTFAKDPAARQLVIPINPYTVGTSVENIKSKVHRPISELDQVIEILQSSGFLLLVADDNGTHYLIAKCSPQHISGYLALNGVELPFKPIP
jgi:hypothetical protein